MWWVKDNPDHSRGGFQNRDVGRSQFDNDYGPNYGVDYARFSDEPNPVEESRIEHFVKGILRTHRLEGRLLVKNGFVFLQTETLDANFRSELRREMSSIPGVKDVVISPYRTTINRH